MIETEQSVIVGAGMECAWDVARDIGKWAALMPGLQSFNIIDADNSHWTLKVGASGLIRTVKVHVHVTEWSGPEKALFTFTLEGDPVQGNGAYVASPKGPNMTEVTLKICIQGSGPMAPMWEALGKPLLPVFARMFAEQFKLEIEQAAGKAAQQTSAPHSILAIVWKRFRDLWSAAAKSAL